MAHVSSILPSELVKKFIISLIQHFLVKNQETDILSFFSIFIINFTEFDSYSLGNPIGKNECYNINVTTGEI